MKIIGLVAGVILLGASAASEQGSNSPLSDVLRSGDDPSATAPPQLADWRPLIGRWDLEVATFRDDGVISKDTDDDWIFFYIFEGNAVQDVYMSPGEDVDLPDGATRFFGTNIRAFVRETGLWKIVFATNRFGTPAQLEARGENDQIVMWFPSEIGQEARTRIRFYNMTGETFDWINEYTENDGETWAPRQEIRGFRKGA